MPVKVTEGDIIQIFPDKWNYGMTHPIRKYLKDDYDVFVEMVQTSSFYLAGGIFRSIINNEPIKDLDVYPKSDLDYNVIAAILNLHDWDVKYSSTCASYNKDGKVIQLMDGYYGEANEILSKFDFTICMVAWHPGTGIYYIYKDFFTDLENHDLIFNINAEYPIRSIQRSYKYIDYGFWLRTIDLLAMIFNTWYLNLADNKVLMDQLSFYTEKEDEITDQVLKLRYDCMPKMDNEKLDFLKKIAPLKIINDLENNRCATCGKDVTKESFRNRISVKEFKISGMCQECQDEVFGED